MDKAGIVFLVMWLGLLAAVIALLALGNKPQDLIGEFLGLATPFLYPFFRKRKR